jgi:photosystem II stability/assembly factor-like uncharacterized protein
MKELFFALIVLVFSPHVNAQTWSQIGPEGGYFKEFVIHPTNSDIVFAGSDDGGGVWKSEDGGDNWTLTTGAYPNMTGWKVVLDDANANTVYTCDLYGRYGVLKSQDGGNSWIEANSGLTSIYDKMVSGLVVKTTDTLFISTGESTTSTPVRPGNGMFKSYDGGATWVQAGLQGVTIPSSGKNDFGTIFAGTEDFGLFYTNNNGLTWDVHPTIPTTGTIFEIETASNVMMVASSEGVFLSTDWGINFANIGLVGEFNFDACIHKTAPDIELYSSTMTGLKRYSSATMNWTTVVGSYFTDQIIIGLDSDGTNVFCSGFSNSPIIKSSDGGSTWAQLLSSPKATELTDMYVDPSNSDHLFACLLGSYNFNGDFDREAIYESNDGGTSWVRKGPDAHGVCLTVNPQNDQEFYLGTFAQGVIKTTDGFDTYTQLSVNGVSVLDVIVSPTDPNTVLISEINWVGPILSIKRSTDAGGSFNVVSNIIANRMLFHPTNSDTIYVATNNGIERSSDNGLTFNPWILSGEDCRTLAFEGGIIYTGTTDGKLFKVASGVATDISGMWSTPVEIKSILIKNDNLFVGMSGAEKDTFMVLQGSIWRSSDDGANWANITTDMTATNIYGSNIIETDGSELYVGTYGGGIFKSSGIDLSTDLYETTIESGIVISPNPSSSIITVELKQLQFETFEIYASNGAKVTNRVHTISNTDGNLKLDISSLNEGVYILQFAMNAENSRSVTLVKN